MSLSVGLDAALSGLSVSSEQTSVVSRNIARAGDPHATRKTANVVTVPGGGVRIVSTTRAADQALFDKMLSTTTDASAQKAILDALNALNDTVGDTQDDASPAAQISKFTSALQQSAQAPQNDLLARSAISAANDLAGSLNSATASVQQVRTQADADIASSVANLNDLLSQFETVNNKIKLGSSSTDVTDELDQRDQILASISEEIGIHTVTRANGDMAIYTDNGLTLFDNHARSVTFTPTGFFTASTTGSAVMVDGVPVTGNTGLTGTTSGRIAALAQVRDTIAVTYQSQLDEIARGLIRATAESDQSATPTLSDAPGLFTWSGAPAMPGGSVQTGLAGMIKVNASVDPAQGGNPALLRDGGISNPGNPAYTYNAAGASGFSDRLNQLIDSLDTQQTFDPAAGAGAKASVADYAASSVAWLQAERKSASDASDYKSTLLSRSTDALSSATGVNLDEEMTMLLDLERSYQASSKLITTIDNMYGALLAAAGR
jgi:flagellar hook-associated protein 1